MKKIVFLFLIILFSFQISKAQDISEQVIPEETPIRTTVVLDYFGCPPTVPMFYMNEIRQGVMAAFLNRGRNDIIDAYGNLPSPMYNNIYNGYNQNNSYGNNPYDNNAYNQNTYQVISPTQVTTPVQNFTIGTPRLDVKKTGARYVVNGYLTGYMMKKEVGGDKKIRFTSKIKFVLSTYDMKNSRQLEPREFSLLGTGASTTEADMQALKNMRSSVEFYIEDNFKFKTEVLEMEKPDKKGRVKGIYLKCGSQVGVRNGDLFHVYALDNIGGVETYRHIGKVRARQIMSDVVTFCSISSGATDIVGAFNSGAKMMAVSAGEAWF